jgi:hypothetical protein
LQEIGKTKILVTVSLIIHFLKIKDELWAGTSCIVSVSILYIKFFYRLSLPLKEKIFPKVWR